ncbi:GNAT family N-acetyltransferase [uncultured Ilumatobacter sp.]|uniref:GNAT family N-acetyltransferase n=1 Tax=uncultured Ilumatobacter sp. TaxID=879968 RepID=UPI00374E42A1
MAVDEVRNAGEMTDAPPASIEPLPGRVTSPRLTLRRWHHDEAATLSAGVAASLEYLRPWMPWARFEPLTLAERVRLIEGWTRDWEEGGDVVFGVFRGGEIIGGAGLHRRSGPGTLDIGYWIHVNHVRHGYATELTTALTTTAFGIDGIQVVHIQTDEANEASASVPAKLGFRRSATIDRAPEAPAESGRLIDWTMTPDVWATRAAHLND